MKSIAALALAALALFALAPVSAARADVNELQVLTHTEPHGRKVVVFVDSHQHKHQTTKIPGLNAYGGAPGDKFPAKVDLAYHVAHIAPIVQAWAIKMQGYIMAANGKGYLPKDKYALAPGKIDFDVVATYDKAHDTINVTYHCNPNRDSKPGDF